MGQTISGAFGKARDSISNLDDNQYKALQAGIGQMGKSVQQYGQGDQTSGGGSQISVPQPQQVSPSFFQPQGGSNTFQPQMAPDMFNPAKYLGRKGPSSSFFGSY